MDQIQAYLEQATRSMEKAYMRTQGEFAKIRVGRALPSMLDGISVMYYGNATPIHQVASISAPDARTLLIKPWEKRFIPELEKAIFNSRLPLTPQNDGETIRINIPPFTEERRRELVKQVKAEAEKGKVLVRSVRKDIKDHLRQLQTAGVSEDAIKTAEEQVQKLTDAYITKLDELLATKEKDVMEV
ncbi:MAG: ribosome recycling factor [Amoebophilaceae bacterium]|jgi:ribosome recycling factor|nr:ribosome recycling factor [Amoebophilaceae bacterium]